MKAQKKNNNTPVEVANLHKAIETQVKNETKKAEKIDFDALFATNKKGGSRTNSIYTNEVYGGLTLKDEKSKRRRQIRRKLEAFLSDFVTANGNETKLKDVFNAWKQYAPIVYKRPFSDIYDGTDEQQKNLCNRFLEAMNKLNK